MNFTPAVYEHAARLIGVTPWQASRDQNLMIQGHAAAFRRYHHVPVVAGIDIYNLEPEALGAVIEEPAGNGIPSIKAHPCGAVDEIPELTPFDPRRDGRIPMVIEAAQILK
jgi:hypothetical protein